MYPSRPAPSPPKGASLPPHHPFSTYYIPPRHAGRSFSSFTASSAPSSPSSPTSAGSAAGSRESQSSTLTFTAAASRIRTDSRAATARTPTYLPTELALFDPRPRQTLLDDLEFIAGKRLKFPFINKLIKSKADAAVHGDSKRQRRAMERDQVPELEV